MTTDTKASPEGMLLMWGPDGAYVIMKDDKETMDTVKRDPSKSKWLAHQLHFSFFICQTCNGFYQHKLDMKIHGRSLTMTGLHGKLSLFIKHGVPIIARKAKIKNYFLFLHSALSYTEFISNFPGLHCALLWSSLPSYCQWLIILQIQTHIRL